MRWLFFTLCLILTGLAQMALAPRVELPYAHGEYLFLIAFQMGLHCPSSGILPAFFLAGLTRDIFIGGRLGAGTLTYLLAGALLLALHDKVEGHHVILRALYVFFSLLVSLCLLTLMESGWNGWGNLFPVIQNSLFTALISPAALLLLNLLPLQTSPRR